MAPKPLADGDIIERTGRKFKVRIIQDDGMREPWKEADGQGVITDWTSRTKTPGERVLCTDGIRSRYYDVQRTLAIARRDGWGLTEKAMAALEKKLGRKPTLAEITAEAVEQDFQRMKAWCDDEWHWVGVAVVWVKEDPDAKGGFFETVHQDSLWGIESDAGDYLMHVAEELADELLAKGKIK